MFRDRVLCPLCRVETHIKLNDLSVNSTLLAILELNSTQDTPQIENRYISTVNYL